MKIKYLYVIIIFYSHLLLSQTKAKVVGIKDGDTVVVLLNDNTQKTLRLAEVDCPESGQPFGKNAKQFTSDQILRKTIEYIETDSDRYGRTIAKIYYDNHKYLSEELIKVGFGWWYEKYSKNLYFGELQKSAKSKGFGLWSDKNAIAPWNWRIKKNK